MGVPLVEAKVRRPHSEWLERFTGRKPLKPRYEYLDDETAVRLEMRCGVPEAGHLLVLRRQVHDRVRDYVGDREPALDGGCGEVADCHPNLVRARFRQQPRDHRLREIDPVHTDAALRKWQRDSAGADTEFERLTARSATKSTMGSTTAGAALWAYRSSKRSAMCSPK